MLNTVYVLVDPVERRTFAEVGEDGITCVTLAFVTRKAAHAYRNEWGLPMRLQPHPFAPSHLDQAAAMSLETFGELATWRLVTDRSIAPNISADRVDPLTGDVEPVRWGQYWSWDYALMLALAELIEDKPLMLAEVA